MNNTSILLAISIMIGNRTYAEFEQLLVDQGINLPVIEQVVTENATVIAESDVSLDAIGEVLDAVDIRLGVSASLDTENSNDTNEEERLLDLGNLNVILMGESSSMATGDKCYLYSSSFCFRILDATDVTDAVISPIGRIYNVYDRKVSITLTAI